MKNCRQHEFDQFADIHLHRFQFVEVACRSFYRRSLFNDDAISYSAVRAGDGPLVIEGRVVSDGPIWHDGDEEEFAACLYRHLSSRHPGISNVSDLYVGDDNVITFLHNPDGTPRHPTADELS